MRINLRVPFEQKDQAKSLGAKWDAARKTWYVVNPESLEPFHPWIGHLLQAGIQAKAKPRRDSSPPVTITGPNYIRVCDCMPPWETCEHTEQPIDDPEALAHLASIQ